jgi:hypothetical protein
MSTSMKWVRRVEQMSERRNKEERYHLGDLVGSRRIILKWILEKYSTKE